MARTQSHPTRAVAPAPAPESPSWSQWPLKLQTLQFNAAKDLLGVFNRYLAALGAARDAQSFGEAQRTFGADWLACIEDAQRQWAGLARLVPAEAWNATGWRLKPAARASASGAADEMPRDLFEQSKLGFEMLLRPWLPVPDLEHTDEFVA